MPFKDRLEHLRSLPEDTKKMILFSIVGVLAVGLGILWALDAKNTASKVMADLKDHPIIPSITINTPATPQPSGSTADWQTYQSSDAAFSLKYPAGWVTATNGGNTYFAEPDTKSTLEGATDYRIDLFVQDNPKGLSARDFITQLLADNDKIVDGPKLSYQNAFELVINGYPAYELSGVFAGDEHQETIYLTDAKHLYEFSFPSAEANPNFTVDPITYNAIAHQVVNSFTFAK